MNHLKYISEHNINLDFKIFQDMDGCLTDFEGNFKNISDNKYNLSPYEYEEKYGKFSMWELIGKEGIKWWSEMPWIEGGRELWEYIKQYDPIILSAPSRDPISTAGKMIWINRELNISQNSPTVSPKLHRWDDNSRIILNSQKFLFSKRYNNSILIDDTYKQIANWEKSGGVGILHSSSENTINELKKII